MLRDASARIVAESSLSGNQANSSVIPTAGSNERTYVLTGSSRSEHRERGGEMPVLKLLSSKAWHFRINSEVWAQWPSWEAGPYEEHCFHPAWSWPIIKQWKGWIAKEVNHAE
jgi:hypothetical protein